ncbi:MAG: hemolysin family protein, partial [Candidatus Omnitrophica bacterium]|nr:hemolysin family protein [Candidatus Omnitrophota bacterium]
LFSLRDMILGLSLPFLFLVLIFLAGMSFFFSACETSIVGLSKIRLRHLISKGIKSARYIQNLINQFDKFIAGILLGNDFVNIGISSIITALFVSFLGYRWGVLTATVVASFLVLVFCEITPKILAIKHTEKIALFTAPIMNLMLKIMHPLIIIFTSTSNFILRLLRIRPPKRSPLITEEEIKLMIEIGKEEGVLTEEERRLLHRIFEFGEIKVREVMVPLKNMVAIEIKSSAEKLMDLFVEEGHARIPVYKDSLDNILGIIYARDLLYILRDRNLFILEDLVRPAYFVFEETRVNDLLREFQRRKIQIAIVVDKENRAKGLVTLEDLIEEIVGEIDEVYHSDDFLKRNNLQKN